MPTVTFASINDRVHHKGVVYTACVTLANKPNNLALFTPTKELVYGHKHFAGDKRFSSYRPLSSEEYTRQYALLLKSRSSQIRKFIDSIDRDITICCFCSFNAVFCHRQLLARWFRSYRSDLVVQLF